MDKSIIRSSKSSKSLKIISKKIWDLSENIGLKKNLEFNLKLVSKKFGKKFQIKYCNIIIPVVLEKISLDTNNFTFYRLYYDENKTTNDLIPFKIDFYDVIKQKKNSNSYIAEIHKTNEINGSTIVELVLEINSKLGVKKSYLYDGTSVNCLNDRLDLSIIKLIDNGMTFYMKFGFEIDITKQYNRLLIFKNKKEWINKINYLLKKINLIKISDLISQYKKTLDLINQVVKTQDYNDLEIILINTVTIKPFGSNDFNYIEDKYKKINDLFEESNKVLNILMNTNEIYLGKYLIKLFESRSNCNTYKILIDYLCYNNIYKIVYKKNIIIRKYAVLFEYLIIMRRSFYFSYTY